MRVTFNDLFELNREQRTLSPRRVLRLGAMKLVPETVLSLDDTSLGVPLSTWVGREFEVDHDDECVSIRRVVPD